MKRPHTSSEGHGGPSVLQHGPQHLADAKRAPGQGLAQGHLLSQDSISSFAQLFSPPSEVKDMQCYWLST